MKKTIFISIATLTAAIMSAQTVNVHFTNGQTIRYNSSNVDYVDFSEKEPDPTITAGQVVDLGLSVLWASCNLGAESPEEYGNYYAWGETKTKGNYNLGNYSYYDDNLKRYTSIGDNISGTEYDAANVNLGSDWRIPTKDEIQELIDMCTCEWTQISGVNGFKFTGSNGNSIFMPASGEMVTSNCMYGNEYLHYWSSNASSDSDVYGMTNTENPIIVGWFSKWEGRPIRPVTTNPNAAGTPIDHSQDNIVTSNVTAHFLGGAVMEINGLIQSGSQLNVQLTNGSEENITLIKLQLIDSNTMAEGNNLLTEEVPVAAGTKAAYTITVGALGIYNPIVRFTYRYNNKSYTAEAKWSN